LAKVGFRAQNVIGRLRTIGRDLNGMEHPAKPRAAECKVWAYPSQCSQAHVKNGQLVEAPAATRFG
jgi:hypothetical protein